MDLIHCVFELLIAVQLFVLVLILLFHDFEGIYVFVKYVRRAHPSDGGVVLGTRPNFVGLTTEAVDQATLLLDEN